VEKTVEIELQTETQISRSGEETMPLKRMPKALIEEQRQHLTRLRELTAFACIPDKDLDRIARAIHDANRRRLKRDNSFTLRDPAQVGWTELQAAMKDATRDRASWIVMMLRAMGLTLRAVPSGRDPAVFFLAPGEVEEMAKMEHERWVSAKLRDGWQYGPNRDDNRRSHPCLVPWDQLGPSEQERDRVVVREIPQVVASAGYEIVRM
jgi:hypothetical protein